MKTLILCSFAVCISGVASAQSVVLMPDSTNNRIVTFSPVDGSVINSSLFSIPSGTTPISAIAVGSEIWVSEQIGDKISRYDSSGTLLGTAGVGILDNCRGITLINGVVYAANDGTAFGAGDTLVRFDTSGNHLGNYSTAGLNTSPFYVMELNGTLLTSSSSANNDVHRFNMDGSDAGMFYNGSYSFAEQMAIDPSGNVLVGWFTSDRISVHSPTTGAEIGAYVANDCRGVYQLSNGNILWSSGLGAFVYNVATSTSTQVYTGGGRFFSLMGAAAQELNGDLVLNDTVAPFAATRSMSYSVVQGSTVIASGTILAGSQSTPYSISLPPSASGAAKLIFDGSSFLKKTTDLVLNGVSQNMGAIALQNGDVNNNTEVDPIDLDMVISDFGSQAVGTTDVNVSGEVDPIDVDIVIGNFGGQDN